MRAPFDKPAEQDSTFAGLHWMAAGLFLASGAEAALDEEARKAPPGSPPGIHWAPLLAGPLAGAVHIAHALRPGQASRTATQILNGVAIGVGAAAAARALYSAFENDEPRPLRRRRRAAEGPLAALAPLTFGLTGLLGLLLDQEEREDAAEHRRLERRARVVERLVPKRRARVDHIVIHV